MKTMNLGLVAHVDAGKTTLTEQMLYASGAVRTAGSVDSGTTQTDWLPVEQSRGITVQAAATDLTWRDTRFFLIDTPGHVDFSGQVERSLSVLDAAVLVVSAVEGVQAQTEVLLEAFHTLKLPFAVFINKIDRAGSDSVAVLAHLTRLLSPMGWEPLAVNPPNGEGSESVAAPCHGLEDPAYLERLVTAAAGVEESILETYLDSGRVAPDTLQSAIRRGVAGRRIVPVVFGASKLGLSVEVLLDCLNDWFPAASADTDGPFCAQVYKVEHEKGMGKVAFVRLFSGCVRNRDSVYLRRADQEEKVTQIRRVLGRQKQDLGELTAGESGALYGLSSVKAGDFLGRVEPPNRTYSMTQPLLTVQVLPAIAEERMPLLAALQELSDEDPFLDVLWIPEKEELHIRITGRMQLEILEILLRDRYGLSVTFSEASVIYKETLCKAGEGVEIYTMPKPCWAKVWFRMEPLPRGSGLQYDCVVPERRLLQRYRNHVATAVPRALEQGLYGWEVTDLKVTLIDGEHHLEHTHPLDFFVATPMGIMNGLEHCGTKLLEPIYAIRLTGPAEALGKTISLLVARRAVFDSPGAAGERFTLEGEMPVAESLDFPTAFASVTGGRGVFSARFSHYADAPAGVEATAPRRGVDPRDRAKWILHARQAL